MKMAQAPEPDRSEEQTVEMCPPLAALSPDQARRLRLDSPVRTLLGLATLWVVLMLIFYAHSLSDSYLHLETPGVKSPQPQEHALFQAMEPHETLLLPFSMRFHDTTPLQALSNIAKYADFRIADSELDRLERKGRKVKEARTLQFDVVPLYRTIHELLGTSSLGFVMRGRNVGFIEQIVEETGAPEQKYVLDWKADVELDRHRLLIFPSGTSDLSFSVRLLRDVSVPDAPWRLVQVEVWKGTECLTMAKAALDETGKAQLSMSNVENIAFLIDRQVEPKGDQPGRYNLHFVYQTFK